LRSFVVVQARGRGIGRLLTEACVRRARDEGASRLVLSTRPIMGPALGLYASMGFVRRPDRDWEPLPGVPLIVYVLELAG